MSNPILDSFLSNTPQQPKSQGQPYPSPAEKARDVADPRYSERLLSGHDNPQFNRDFHNHVNARLLATSKARKPMSPQSQDAIARLRQASQG